MKDKKETEKETEKEIVTLKLTKGELCELCYMLSIEKDKPRWDIDRDLFLSIYDKVNVLRKALS